VGSDGIKFGLEIGNLVESRNIMSLIIKVRNSGNHIALESHAEKMRTQVKLPTLTCFGKLGGINMNHHIHVIFLFYFSCGSHSIF
jgi:hypothetical protein